MHHVCHSALTTIQVSHFKSKVSKAPPLTHGHAHRTHLISPLHSAHAARQDQAPQRPPPPWRQPQETQSDPDVHFHKSEKSWVMCECAHTWADVP